MTSSPPITAHLLAAADHGARVGRVVAAALQRHRQPLEALAGGYGGEEPLGGEGRAGLRVVGDEVVHGHRAVTKLARARAPRPEADAKA